MEILEFQGPTGPLNSSSCGEHACFARLSVRFAHILLLLTINIIISTINSNRKCLSPPTQCKKVCPPLMSKNVYPPAMGPCLLCSQKCLFAPILLLCIYVLTNMPQTHYEDMPKSFLFQFSVTTYNLQLSIDAVSFIIFYNHVDLGFL